ncbi:MAG: CHASE2 domain-containing protein [Acidobacteria bacterium]|nr:CHASE2 domain-containing protein [Acidobacteriota bacterium]MBI3488334.1 CHASE2 domain-containing protein [Acidobacteriota bacterium]
MPIPRSGPANREAGPSLSLLWPILVGLLALALQASGLLSPAELLLRDALLRAQPGQRSPKVAVVLIDEAAIRSQGRWPWDRPRLARLVDGLFAAGARGVAIDFLFPEAGEGDADLVRALNQGPSALAAGVDDSGHWLLPDQAFRGLPLGHVSFDLDRDGVVRRFSSTKQLEGRALPALPVAAARLADPGLPVPVGLSLRPAFRTRPIPQVSAAALLEGKPAEALRGRLVFLGASAAGIGDRFITPNAQGGSPEPGVLVEAMSTEAILSKDLLRGTSPLVGGLLGFGLGLLGTLLLASRRPVLVSGASLVVLAPLPISAAALHQLNLELAPLAGMSALALVGLLAASLRWRHARFVLGAAQGRIQELERLQRALAETGRQDAEARRVVAHELKTPLTSVRGLAQLLARFDLSGPERNRVAELVVAETSRLTQMVDALLDLERLRLRNFDREAQALDLSALCLRRAEVLRVGLRREIRIEVEPGLQIQGDGALIERALENLVSNALKFSPEHAPVGVRLRAEGPAAILEVEDRGPGVPLPERVAIFGRFARGTTQSLAPGLGLGLALVAEVAAWHNGSVSVRAGSGEGSGEGSCFQVRLPLILRHSN